MNDPKRFDDLARQKMAGRGFPFNDQDWSAMETLLAERRKKRPFLAPWLLAAALVLIGSGAWWVLDGKNEPIGQQAGTNTTAQPSSQNAQQPVDEEALEEVPEASTSETNPGIIEPVIRTEAPVPQPMSPAGKAHERVQTGTRPAPVSDRSSQNSALTINAGVSMAASPPAVTTPTAPDDQQRDAGAVEAKPSTLQETALTVDVESDPPARTITPDDRPVSDPVFTDPTPPTSTTTGPPAADAASAEPIEPADSTLTDPAEVVTAPPSAPAWMAVRSPIEITGLFGGFSTTSRYSGPGTESWSATTDRQNTAGFGVEGMYLCGNFGVGIGVHHSTYAELLTAEERSRTDEEISHYYTLTPVDTAVLTVIDTVWNGTSVYYITEPVPTTINVVTQNTDTSYITTILRQRRTMVNKVSYVEIPLLLDAHVSTGRWMFGVRGGPTFGLLSGRRGFLPADAEGGYADLQDRPFRSLTMGATGRAYARYRIGKGWSIGLEPTYRTQLANAFDGGDDQRRSSAFGAYLSLSYRFAAGAVTP